MTEKNEILDLMVHEQMVDMLANGTNQDRDRTRVFALMKVLPKYIDKVVSEKLKKTGAKKNGK